MKNLSPQASVAQLVALFSRFEQESGPPVLYRLLTGRLKGQAFITLPGESNRSDEWRFIEVNGERSVKKQNKPFFIFYFVELTDPKHLGMKNRRALHEFRRTV